MILSEHGVGAALDIYRVSSDRKRMRRVPLSTDLAVDLATAALAGSWLAMLLLGGSGFAPDAIVLHAFHAPALVPFALVVTRLGNAYVLLPLCAVAAAALALAGRRRDCFVYIGLVLSGRLLVEAEKHLVGRPRPDPSGQLDSVASMAFPSAHAANSMVAWLGLALLVASPRLRPAAIALALAIAILVGLSRLVLAVHWPSDVVGGWTFGAAWTLLFLRLADRFSDRSAAPAAAGQR